MSRAYAVPFAPFTEATHDRLRPLPRVCEDLYQWIRRMAPPGTLLEINLQAFVEQYGRSIQWSKKCFDRLVSAGLVEQVKQWWGYDFQIRLIDPDYQGNAAKTSRQSDRDERPSDSDESFKTAPSNPDSAVPSYKGDQSATNSAVVISEKTASEPVADHPPALDRAGDLQEASGVNAGAEAIGDDLYSESSGDVATLEDGITRTFLEAPFPPPETPSSPGFAPIDRPLPSDDLPPQTIAAVARSIAPCPLTPSLLNLLMRTAAEHIEQAIDYLNWQKSRQTIANPAGFLYDAIAQNWDLAVRKPPAKAKATEPAPPPVFVAQDWQRESIAHMYAAQGLPFSPHPSP